MLDQISAVFGFPTPVPRRAIQQQHKVYWCVCVRFPAHPAAHHHPSTVHFDTFVLILVSIPNLYFSISYSTLFHSSLKPKSVQFNKKVQVQQQQSPKCPSQPLRRLDFTPCLGWHPVQRTIVPPPRPFAMPNPPRTTNFPKREEDDPSLPFKEQQTLHLSPLPLVPRVVATRPIGTG